MVLTWNKKMMSPNTDVPGSGAGNTDPEPTLVPELVVVEEGVIALAEEEVELRDHPATINVINAFSDKGYALVPNGKSPHYHDFTPSFLNHSDEPNAPADPPSDPQVNV